jgi:hypothetical protein
MENITPEEASAALAEAQASGLQLAGGLVLPSYFHASLGLAIAVQIATTATGLADQGLGGWLLVGVGVVLFLLVAGIQLARFRQLNGVWLGTLASRVVGGTATFASVSYGVAAGAAVWAAISGHGWLVPGFAILGGAAYTVGGRRWWRTYQADPQANARGESAFLLALTSVVVIAGLVALLINR